MSAHVPRYDEKRQIYRNCRWCHGRGCLQCEAERDKEYLRQFPSGPQPVATFDISTPEGARTARQLIGVEAMQSHFGPGGDGIEGLMAALAKVVKS